MATTSHTSKGIAMAMLLFLLVSTWNFGIAQGPAYATIKVVRIYGTYNSTNESEDYRFRFQVNSFLNLNCLKANQVTHHNWVDVNYTIKSNLEINLGDPITIEAKAWEEDGCGGDCSYDGSCGNDDNGVCNQAAGQIHPYSLGVSSISLINGTSFTLNDVPPGEHSDNLIEMWFCGGAYKVHLLVTYTPPQPSAPTILVGANPYPQDGIAFNLCNETSIQLTTSTDLLPIYHSQIQYLWEYHVAGDSTLEDIPNPAYCGGSLECQPADEFYTPPADPPPCCYEPPIIQISVPVWRTIGVTTKEIDGDAIVFDARQLEVINVIIENASFFARAKIITSNKVSLPGNASDQINISPPAPTIGGFFSTPDCPNDKTGQIHLLDINGFGDYIYRLKDGFDQTEPCNPDIDGDCFHGTWGTDIDHILADAGNYTLWLINTGTFGNCYTTVNIPVAGIPILEIKLSSLSHVSCHGNSTGAIVLDKVGGTAPYQYTLSNVGSNSTGIFSDLPVNDYTATITDGCGQTNSEASRSLIIKQPVKLGESQFYSEGATCVNPGNGEFNSIVTKPMDIYDTIVSNIYSFKLLKDGAQYGNTYESSDPIWNRNDLPVGNNYQLIVTENGSGECNAYSKTFSVGAPEALDANILNSTNISCFGLSDGELTLEGNGGSNQFLFKISRAPGDTLSNTTGDFTGLGIGDYHVVIENNLPDCNDREIYANPHTITQPELITIGLTKSNVTCFGAQNGNIGANVSGGTPSYSYTWEENIGSLWVNTGPNTSSLNELSAGTFRLHIVDSKNCPSISETVLVTEPFPLSTPLILINDIQCFGQSTTIEIESAGGTLPYYYFYSQNGGTDFSPLISGTTNLPAGNYTIKTIDGNGCAFEVQETQTITSPLGPLNFSYNQSNFNGFNIPCHGGNNGYIVLNGIGGNGANYSGYQFAIDGSTYQPFDSIANIQAGLHGFSVRDARGCTHSKNILFTEVTESNAQLDHTQNISCFGQADGSIALTGTGGSGQFLFKVSKAPGDTISTTTGNFHDLQAGNYNVVIENNFPGCFDKSNYGNQIAITQPDSVIINLTKNDVSCHGFQDGSILSHVSGGTPSYNYKWLTKLNDSSWEAFEIGSTTLPELPPGTFKLQITDNNTCTYVSQDISLIEPPALSTTSIHINDIQCFGQSGTIEIQSVGGVLPHTYSYAREGEITFSSLISGTTELLAGSYTLRTADGNGCTFTAPGIYSLTAPSSPLNFSYEQANYNGFNISCLGGSNGSIILNGSGGNGGNYSGYHYAINDEAFHTNNSFSSLSAGDYTLSVRDGRGCTYSQNIPFTENLEELIAEVNQTQNVTCHNDSTGRIEVNGSGGVMPYNFSINQLPSQTSNSFVGLAVGIYTIEITDLNGCSTTTNAEVQSLNPEIQIQANVSQVNCYGGHDGSITLNITGGSQPFQFKWNGQSNTTNLLTNLPTGSYSVTVSDNAGCEETSKVDVTQPLQPLTLDVIANPICDGKTGSIEINVIGGTSPYNYSLDGGQTYQSSNIFNSIGAGPFSVRVSDHNMCMQTQQGNVLIRNRKGELNFLVSTRQNALDTLVIKEISLPRPDSIHWIFDTRAIVIKDDQWAPEIKFDEPGLYTVNMTGYYGDCDYTIEKLLTLKPSTPFEQSGKSDYRTISSISASPNPNNGNFDIHVKLRKESNVSIRVYDLVGVIQYSENFHQVEDVNQTIDLGQATNGVYLIRVITDTDARDVRIIVQY